MKKILLIAAFAVLGIGSASADIIRVYTSCGFPMDMYISPNASAQELYDVLSEAESFCELKQELERVMGHSIEDVRTP